MFPFVGFYSNDLNSLDDAEVSLVKRAKSRVLAQRGPKNRSENGLDIRTKEFSASAGVWRAICRPSVSRHSVIQN